MMIKKRMQTTVIVGAGIAASVVMFGCSGLKSGDKTEESDAVGQVEKDSGKQKDEKVNFLTEVKPLLEYHCLRCHNTGLLIGELNLETRKLAFASGEGGPFIVPKHPEASKLYQVLKLKAGNKEAMPPVKHQMTDEQRDVIYRWIKQGADWPKDSRGTLRPVVDRPAVAMVGDTH